MLLRPVLFRLMLQLMFPALFLASHTLPAQTADAILGEWYSPDKDGKFLFYKSGDKYFGKVCWLKELNDETGKPKKDSHNNDPAKRNNPMMGTVIFSNFVWDPDEKEWVDGKVYDARNGDVYCCRIRLVSASVMEVRGYILFSWLGQSRYFTKY